MLLKIGEASLALGVCADTLRRWEKDGLINPIRLASGHRRFDLDQIKRQIDGNRTKSSMWDGLSIDTNQTRMEI